MNYLKYLQEYRKYVGSDTISVLYNVDIPDVGVITKSAGLSDAELVQAAIAKGKTTWDEEELCEALGLEPV